MKAVDFAVSQILPPELRQPTYDLSKKGMAVLMAQVASAHPDKFGEIAKRLGDLGRNAAWYQGYSATGEDTAPIVDTSKYYKQMDAELKDLRKQKLSDDEFDEQRNAIMLRYSNLIEKDTMRESLARGNSFARAVASGARGNPAHVKAILSTPGIYTDTYGKIIPLFVRHSFAEGVRPAELLAGTYGGRLAITSTKKATARGGDLAKILNQSTSNYNVTEKDCGVSNGLDLDPQDDSLSGRVLAQPVGDIPTGTVIDKKVLSTIRKQTKPVVVRSAMTCRAKHGLCAKCVGVQSDGRFPKVGDSVGITASQSISEPIVQGSLNVKHNAGMAKSKRSFSGLDYVSQFVQIPDDFKDRAAVSELDGTVDRIEDAPQGGKYIFVDGKEHLALPGYEPTVKVGDHVEAGDQLSDGLVSPADIVRLRGLGEGRRYYADRLGQILADSGNPPDRRNMEIIAKATVDNYIIDDPDADMQWNPDDLVRESEFLGNYTPPTDTTEVAPSKGVGSYLQKPALHYTVGTKLTKKMADRIDKAGMTSVAVSKEQPWFTPEMKRLRVASHDTKDWMASLGTSYLSTQMRQALERGDETNVRENYHFGPRLAYGGSAGSGRFGENIETTGKF